MTPNDDSWVLVTGANDAARARVRAGIRALQAGRVRVAPGWGDKTSAFLTWTSTRWLSQARRARLFEAGP